MSTRNLVILIVVAIIVVWGVSIASKKDQNPIKINTGNQTTGTVSTTTDAQMVYENKNLGLQFNFPLGWHAGVNTLGDSSGYGYLQLFNYDETKASGSVFPEGENKIEIAITDENTIATSSDYPEQSRKTNQVQIAGKTATQFDIILSGSQKYRAYIIPFQSRFLRMVIYGDPANFYLLDNIVKSIVFVSP